MSNEYFDQNRSIDHENSLRDIFLGHPVQMYCRKLLGYYLGYFSSYKYLARSFEEAIICFLLTS